MKAFARLAAVTVLALLASGLPRAALAALDDECCEERCDGAPDGTHCPPNCSGPCAGGATPAGLWAGPCVGRQPVRRATVETRVTAPALPLVVVGVFQPPKA